MLLETMSYEEMWEEVAKDRKSIAHHTQEDGKKLVRNARNHNQTLYFQKSSDFVTSRKNKYKVIYRSKNKEVHLQIFVELQTKHGKDYLLVKEKGIIHFTSHYISRFKERSNIPNFKESLLFQYMCKEPISEGDMMETSLSRFYIPGRTGLIIIENKSTPNLLVFKQVTYMSNSNLSPKNDLINKMIQ